MSLIFRTVSTKVFFLLRLGLFGLTIGILPAFVSQAATPWPVDTGAVIADTTSLGEGYEPSGIVYHSERDQFVMVGDDGDITVLSTSGNVAETWNIALDLEGVTVADPTSDLIYVVNEEPATLIEFNLATGAVTGNEWDLTAWIIDDAANDGAEALTFVPNEYHTYAPGDSGGLFYVGQQSDGVIYIVDVNLNETATITYIDAWEPPTGITSDISGLHFEASAEKIYALYDGFDTVVEWNLDGTISTEYNELPVGDQEGITMRSNCPASESAFIYIVDDVSAEVIEYSGFPITCVEEVEVVPTEPTNLKIKKLGSRKVKVSWQGEATEYKLQLRKKSGTLIKRFTATATNQTISKKYLKKNRTYKIRMKACVENSCSNFTNYKKFST